MNWSAFHQKCLRNEPVRLEQLLADLDYDKPILVRPREFLAHLAVQDERLRASDKRQDVPPKIEDIEGQ